MVAASNASIKYRQLGGFWIISNPEKISEIKHSIHDKYWDYGSTEGGEATILLDLIVTIVLKSKHISEGSISIGNDNKLLVKAINKKIMKENQYTTSTRAKIS